MSKDNLELMFTMNFKKQYVLRHKQEQLLLKRHIQDTTKFFKLLNNLKTIKSISRHIWITRLIKCMHLVSALSLLVVLAYFLMDYTNSAPEASSLEKTYIYFSISICIVFVVTILTALLEYKCLPKLIKQSQSYLNQKIADTFDFNCSVEIDRTLIIRMRILTFEEGESILRDGNDYFEYIKMHKPDSKEYYKNSSNPFEFDPHERNFAAQFLKNQAIRAKEEKRKKRKDRMFKGGFGGGSGGGKFGKKNKFGVKNKLNK